MDMMELRSSLLANMEAREKAAEYLAFIEADLPPEFRNDRFWEKLAAAVAAKLPKPAETVSPDLLDPMNDAQAARFERETMISFGKYASDPQPVAEVPINYLCMLVDDSPLKRQLRRYLRSERGQRRQIEG